MKSSILSAFLFKPRQPWKPMLILGTFGVSMILGVLLVYSRELTLLFLAMFAGLFLILITFRYLWLALTILIATSAIAGITISSGSATPIPFNMLFLSILLGLWLLRMALVDRRIYLLPSQINFPFVAFVLSAALSWLFGNVTWDWRVPGKSNLILVQAGQVAIFALSIFATLLVANHPVKEKYLRWWLVILVGILAVNLGYGFYIHNPKPFPYVDGSVLMWPILMLWAQAIFNRNIKLWHILLITLATSAWGYWALKLVFDWKGGWLPALLGLGVLLMIRYKRYALVLFLAAGLLLFMARGYIDQNIIAGEQGSGSTVRPLYWLDVIRMASRSPLFGLGPANYEYYWQDPTFVPLSRIASGWDAWNTWGYSPPSHNMFVDIYAQNGLLGLVFFTWGMVAGLRITYRLALKKIPGFMQAYAYGVFAGVLSLLVSSFMFADWLLPYVYNITISGFAHSIYSWLLLGSVIAYDHTLSAMEEIDVSSTNN
jgi:hypothetical protein